MAVVLSRSRIAADRWISVTITACQLLQMVVGCVVNFYAIHVKSNGGECDVSYLMINFALIMYFSYFALFTNFFYNSYIVKKPVSATNGAVKKLE